MSSSNIPFLPQGETFVIAADVAAPAGVQVTVSERNANVARGQYRVVNSSANIVHLAAGNSDTDAQAKAVAPVAGNPSAVVTLLPGAIEILRFPAEAYFSAIAPAGASTVYIVAGEGI